MTDETNTQTPPFLTLEDWQHWTWVMGRAQQMMMEYWAEQADQKPFDPAALDLAGPARRTTRWR